MNVFLRHGTGRAICKHCKKVITKKEVALIIRGWHFEKQFHKKCIDKLKVIK